MGLVVVVGLKAEDKKVQFAPDTLVVTRSVYTGTADTITPGHTLPLGCAGGANGTTTVNVPLIAGGTTPVTVTCGVASDNGEFPNLNDSHNVWNNAATDGSFGITSPIFLDNLTTRGTLLGTLAVPTNLIVTSFSSKSELAINLSVDGNSLTFMGYQGGPGCAPNGASLSPTAANLIDVSASNTPGICDPTNPVISSDPSNPTVPTAYYRAVAEVDAQGNITVTPGNAYSGDNGRAKKGGNGLYYMAGNDNSGNLSKKQLTTTVPGVELINATGAELLTPLQVPPPAPPDIGMIGRLLIPGDKPGKDTNFRGLTIFDNTLYISKGSGGNGTNSVYQAGSTGVLPTGTAAQLATVLLTTLPGLRMQNAWQRQVTLNERAEAFPGEAMPLTATPERLQPGSCNLPPEHPERPGVPRHGMVVEVALYHRPQPIPGVGHPLMPALAQFLPNRLQFTPQSLLGRQPSHRKPATLPSLPADVRESQKIEGLGFALPSPPPVTLRESPKLDQPRFLRVQFQPELLHPLPQLLQEHFRVLPVLETQHSIIGVANHNHVPSRCLPPPLVHPEIEDIMQVDVD
jgi:hypothetical protein